MIDPSDPAPFTRRRLLASAGAASAGAMLLSREVCRADNPAEQVADRGANLRITGLRGYHVGGKLYLKIETNRKITGWGETFGLRPDVALALAESLFDLLDGENPTRIEHLWQKVYRAHRDARGGPYMTNVLSAIDIALWDITGKAWGVPIYRLLGGPTRQKIRMYPSPTAYKIGPGGPKRHAGTPREITGYVNEVARQRERLGPDGAVMLDVHCAVPPAMLIQLAAAIKPYDVLWIEEPAVPGNIEVFKRLKQAIDIPLATGERDRTIWGMIPYLHERCIDILQPDVGATGGISQMKKIATLAEAYYVPLAPHCASTVLGLTASLHAVASIPLFLIHEGGTGRNPSGVVRKPWEVDQQGYASLPGGPGLGLEIDEAILQKLHAQGLAALKNKKPAARSTPQLRDGSVADY